MPKMSATRKFLVAVLTGVIATLIASFLWALAGDRATAGARGWGPVLAAMAERITRTAAWIAQSALTPVGLPLWLWVVVAALLITLAWRALTQWTATLPSEDADDLETLLQKLDEPQKKIMRGLGHADGQPLGARQLRDLTGATYLQLSAIVESLVKFQLVTLETHDYEEAQIRLTRLGVTFVLWWEKRPVQD